MMTDEETLLPAIHLQRSALLDFEEALRFEWLVTNGLGGYASSTVAGVDTRRQHGLLVGALQPPTGQTLLLARIHDEILFDGDSFSLHSAEYHDGTVHPSGHVFLEHFSLDGQLPVWRYRCRDVEIEKTLWLERFRNTVFIRYRLITASSPVRLRFQPFVAHREAEVHTRGDPGWQLDIESRADGCRVQAFPSATPLWLKLDGGRFIPTGFWYWRFLHRRERECALDDQEDLYTPGIFDVDLTVNQCATFVATIHPEDLDLDPVASHERERARQRQVIRQANAPVSDRVRQRLALSADQFVVKDASGGSAIINGYPWCTHWVRDTLIAVPGLCLSTGRPDDARRILRGLVGQIDRGLLPDRFPDRSDSLEYTSVDTTLWLFEAVARYEQATRDYDFVDEFLPQFQSIVDWHRRGTLHEVIVDPSDGLLRAGAPGIAPTWMNARSDGWTFTPRHGKAVEVQALWFNALRLLGRWLERRRHRHEDIDVLSEQCRYSFNRRFWNDDRGYCADVVDGPDGDDASLRPNQIFAASLSHPVLDSDHWQPMLQAVEGSLLTPVGLRSLAPGSHGYVGQCTGAHAGRVETYHQGTIWPWLVGAYVSAAQRARGDSWGGRRRIATLISRLDDSGLGQIGEMFDGEPPFVPAGRVAQAWSVGEVLRVYTD